MSDLTDRAGPGQPVLPEDDDPDPGSVTLEWRDQPVAPTVRSGGHILSGEQLALLYEREVLAYRHGMCG